MFLFIFQNMSRRILTFGEIVSKGSKNINLRIPRKNSSWQLFLKEWYNWFSFLKMKRKKSISLRKSFRRVAEKTAFSWSTADIEEKVWEKANFSISSGFWTKLSGFWANVFLHRQKFFLKLSKLRYTFHRYTSRIKVFDENPMFLNQLTTSRTKNFTEFWQEQFGSAIRTALFESRRTNWRNKS